MNEHTENDLASCALSTAELRSRRDRLAGRAAGRAGLSGRVAGRAAPPLREGGMPVRARRIARAVCLPVGRAGPHGLRAGGAGRCGPCPPGGERAAAGDAGARSRRSTWSCCPGGSWTSRCPPPAGCAPAGRPGGHAAAAARPVGWSRRWPTWRGSALAGGALTVAGETAQAEVTGGDPRRAEGDPRPPGTDRGDRYVRQSTLVQVREHTESTLASTPWPSRPPGWAGPPATIEVIDADLGLSGPLGRAAGTGSSSWSPGCAWARSARCSGWRSPGWPAPTRTWPGCWSWPA